jgi:predicted RND superfamily exporter protein
MNHLLERAADLIIGHRWRVVAVVLVVSVVCGLGLFWLSADFSVEELHATTGEQGEALAALEEVFGADQKTFVLMVTADDVLRPAVLGWIYRASERFEQVDGVERVDSITHTPIPRLPVPRWGPNSQQPESVEPESLEPDSVGTMLERMATGEVRVGPLIDGPEVSPEQAKSLRDVLVDAPLIDGRLVTESRGAALIVVHLDGDIDTNAQVGPVVNEVEQWLDDQTLPQGVEARLAGLPYINATIIERMKRDQTVLLPGAILLALLVLYLAFRWFPAIYLPVAAVVCAATILTGLLGWIELPIDLLNNIVPILIIIIGITDAIHLIHRYGDYVEGGDLTEASRRTFRSMAVACFLTSFTTAVGFASLLVSHTAVLRRFGLVAAAGIVIAYVIIITLVPALLPAVGEPSQSVVSTRRAGLLRRLLDRLAGAHIAHPWVAVGLFLLVAAPVAVFGVVELDVDNAVLDQFDADDPIYQTVRRMEEEGFGVGSLEVVFRADADGRLARADFLNELDAYAEWAGGRAAVQQVEGPTDFLRETWVLSTANPQARSAAFPDAETVATLRRLISLSPRNPLDGYMARDASMARLSLHIEGIGGKATLALANELDERAQQQFGELGVEAAVTGGSLVGSQAINLLTRDLLTSLGFAFAIIFGFMTLVLRSVRLGLISVPVTVLPLLMTAGYMAARGIPLNAATVIIFSISIGLAVDGAIHVLARFREEATSGHSTDEALRLAVGGTGEAVILMYVALALGFGLMMVSSFVPVRRFGELVSVTVLICMVSTLVLLPPLLKLGWRQSEGTRKDEFRE